MKVCNNKFNRDISIDILRGIAILFVIFGHISRDVYLQSYIWGFHMPIFFFISGVLFESSRYKDTYAFVKSKFKSLVLPYIFFYFLTLVYWILIERHTRGHNLTICSQFVGLFYGTYSLDYMYFNGALWFLPCLFSMEIIYWFVEKLRYRWLIFITVLAFNVIGVLLVDVIGGAIWGLNAAMIAICFYAIGHLFRAEIATINRKFRKWLIVIVFICIGLQYIFVPYTGKADLAALDISVPILYIPTGMIGVILYFSLSRIIARNSILEWLGRSSLVLFALQEPVYRVVIFIGAKIMHLETELFRQNMLCCFGATIIVVIVTYPIVICYNRWINPILKML